jgi:hypothetical protein
MIGRSAHGTRASTAQIPPAREGKILIGRSDIATTRTKYFSAHFLAGDCVLGEKYALAANKDRRAGNHFSIWRLVFPAE